MSNPKDWAEVAAQVAWPDCNKEGGCDICRRNRVRVADDIRTALAGAGWVVVEYSDLKSVWRGDFGEYGPSPENERIRRALDAAAALAPQERT